MTYRQITYEERYTLGLLRRQGLSLAEIAEVLGRHRSTILREVRRNRANGDGTYRPQLADWYARSRRSRSRRNSQFGADDFRLVEQCLRRKWSPEQISGRFREDGVLMISHETIYRYTWRDKAAGGHLYKYLRCASKKRRKRHNSYDSRGRLAGKRHIAERPRWVEKRRSIGHWEVDTVVGAGSKDCVATLVERKTGLAILGKLPDRCKTSMSKRLRSVIRREPGRFKTITADNGTEFHDYEAVEQATAVKFYFATPYHSWERGSNENFNGLLRQYLPKRCATRSRNNSTPDRENGSAIEPRRNVSMETRACCGSNLKLNSMSQLWKELQQAVSNVLAKQDFQSHDLAVHNIQDEVSLLRAERNVFMTGPPRSIGPWGCVHHRAKVVSASAPIDKPQAGHLGDKIGCALFTEKFFELPS